MLIWEKVKAYITSKDPINATFLLYLPSRTLRCKQNRWSHSPRSPWLTSYLRKSRSFSELSCSCFTNCKIYWDNNYLLNNFNCIDFNFFIKKSISLNNTKIIIYFPSYYQKLLFDYGINYWLFSRKCYYILKSYTVYYDTEIQYRHNFIKSGLKKKKKAWGKEV